MQTRRLFLQELAVAATALALDPLRGVTALAQEYTNERLGLAVRLPEGWEFSSVADFGALRERQVLQDALDRVSDEPHPLQDPDNLPVFVFEDPRHRDGHFAPGIILYDEPLAEMLPTDEIAAHSRLLRWLSISYRDLRVLEPPAPVELGRTKATVSRISYVHEIDSGESYALDVRTLLVFHPGRAHTYYLVDSANDPREAASVWSDFIASVHYRSV